VARATLRAGAFDYLCKPFSMDVLARIVAAARIRRSAAPSSNRLAANEPLASSR
jgi:DNA-binding response OmpR family regulator